MLYFVQHKIYLVIIFRGFDYMSRCKGAVNQSEFTVYFYPRLDDAYSSLFTLDGLCAVSVKANSAVSACTQVIQDYDPIRITKVFKVCDVPVLVMGG